jgi:hypothetical protein
MFCSACGQQNPDDAKFCANCGKQVTASTTAQPSSPKAPAYVHTELRESGAVTALSVIGFVFGLIGMMGSFIPCIGSLAFFIGIPAALISAIGLGIAYAQNAKKTFAVVAVTISLIGVVISGLQYFSIISAGNSAKKYIEKNTQDMSNQGQQPDENRSNDTAIDDSITVTPIDHINGTCGNRCAKFYAIYKNKVIAIYYGYEDIIKYAQQNSLSLEKLQRDLCSFDDKVKLHKAISVVGKWNGKDEDDQKIDAFQAKQISLAGH